MSPVHPGTVIAIDGGAQVYKSTVAEKLLRRFTSLGILANRLESGNFYRAFAHLCIRDGIDEKNPERMRELVSLYSGRISVVDRYVAIDEKPLTCDLRSRSIEAIVSQVSAYPFLRQAVLDCQRNEAKPGVVLIAEGRDMCTTVFPETPHMFFLTADVSIRALREHNARRTKGDLSVTVEEIEAALKARDAADSSRHASPLKPAQNAVIIDTSLMTSDDVTECVYRTYRSREVALAFQ